MVIDSARRPATRVFEGTNHSVGCSLTLKQPNVEARNQVYRLTGSVLSIAAVLLIASGCDVENVPGNAPPTVREVSLASGPQNGETYGVNETIRVDVISINR